VYPFGSYTHGAAEPHDLDIEVEDDRRHKRRISTTSPVALRLPGLLGHVDAVTST
jgi:hypothetical protein